MNRISHALPALLAMALAVALAGCAAIAYEPVKVDSATPIDAARLGRCPSKLEPGKVCIAQIHANQWVSPTGVRICEPGERYRVTVPPDQVWFDEARRNTPPYGEEGSWIMKLPAKRHNAPFFSLMVDAVPTDLGKRVTDTAVVVTDAKRFLFTAKSVGDLVLYPNDAKGPASDPAHWYQNNAGYIWVIIEREG